MNELFASLPQVETLLQDERIARWFAIISRPVTVDVVRKSLEMLRIRIQNEVRPFTVEEVIQACEDELEAVDATRAKRVINATGVIIHTNLGRAPISSRQWQHAGELNVHYTNLEFNLNSGKRGSRSPFAASLLARLCHSEDALVVNNNAAAIFLILSVFAKRKEVIVSRSELVQIGGGFRIPDILSASGAKLVEVGTTNITTIDDYLGAITERTAMVLKVHRSNFALRGFTEEPATRTLAEHLPPNILLVVDQGSGVLTQSIKGETAVATHIKDGAHLVSFSADKALGSVQGGCIVGLGELVTRLAKSPLYRTVRVGKTVSSLLEAALIDHLNAVYPPALAMVSRSLDELTALGEAILGQIPSANLTLVEDTMTLGGGSTPDEAVPSRSIRIATTKADAVAKALRLRRVPIIATVSKAAVHLNLGTIQADEIDEVVAALRHVVESC